MGTRALAVLFLAPSLALAQTAGTVQYQEISRFDCSTAASFTATFTISLSGTFTANLDEYRLFAQTASCGTALPSGNPLASNPAADTNAGKTLTTTAEAIRQALSPQPACNGANDVTYYLCVYLVKADGVTVVGTATGSQLFQLAVPPRPTISAAPANSAIDVTVTPGTTDTTYTATASISYEAIATPTAGGTALSSGRKSSTSLRIENLTNGTDYSVVAYAYSSALNQGPVSNTVSPVTPQDFQDFWRAYQDAGGREQGGCGGGAGALSPLALLALALRLLRRRS